ncbi:taste receptor type 2 member 8-like [Rana temporaria]|uniref:taste receptor type 2 member 8-like n=1 Tax=Rana temporaria TaxID=8407 RepID=UPI001AADD6A0|nr:taste receptor type 2 member 8-like [Rana temporaria]
MISPRSISFLVSAVLGLVLAIPSNTCIVMGNLDIIRKKGKLSPSDVIFLGKGIVNILLQCVMSLQAILYVFSPFLNIKQAGMFVSISTHCLVYYSFWLTFWLSAHYCTSITNLSYGFFIWIKRILSNFLSHLLFLTALGVFIMSVPGILALNAESHLQSSENSTGISGTKFCFSLSYLVPVTILGIILPFCLSLLCLVLTSSFLLRHVWRVKNNDSGSTRPTLQAHVTALRTIFFLLLIFSIFCMSQVLLFLEKSTQLTELLPAVSWNLQLLSPSVEAAIIFQASNKLRRIILRRFWTRSRRNTET